MTEILKTVKTAELEIAYEDRGNSQGHPVILLHGFPDDVRCWDAVAALLNEHGFCTLVPYLRGFGPTRFLHPATPRSGQQAALGHDLIEFMNALHLPKASLIGYDWGGRAACIAAALRPERVHALVAIGGYTIQDIAASGRPASPEREQRLWYQYYFQTERGRNGLSLHRAELCKLLWRLWSPNWKFDDHTFERTVESFHNPDFIDVVIHSYRHRYGNAPGDPALEHIEQQLTQKPKISVPTLVLEGESDGVNPAAGSESDARYFTGHYDRRVLPHAGHFACRESPQVIARAAISLIEKRS